MKHTNGRSQPLSGTEIRRRRSDQYARRLRINLNFGADNDRTRFDAFCWAWGDRITRNVMMGRKSIVKQKVNVSETYGSLGASACNIGRCDSSMGLPNKCDRLPLSRIGKR